jgi:hypothetical protein
MRWTAVLSLVSAVLMAVPAGSAAQGVPSDPEADSPSGVVYEIPVEQARQDAAPKRTRRSDGPGGTAGAGSGSGGASGGGTSSGADSSNGAGGADATHAKQTSIRSENNFGTSSKVPGASGSGGGSLNDFATSVQTGADTTSGPDDGVVFPLVALLVAVGAGIGVVAGRRALGPRRA